ncbi:MAG: outer membrane beta-barrel protein [Bacteroidota bacterium]
MNNFSYPLLTIKGCAALLVIFLFFIETNETATAQSNLKKNAYNIGGGINFGFSDTDNLQLERTTKDIQVTPSVTYFVFENFALGFNLQLEYREETTSDETTGKTVFKLINKFLSVGPTARYYFHTNNFAPFTEASAGYTTFLKSDIHGIAFSLGAGINYFLTKNIALEPHVIYTLNKFFSPDYRINRYTFGIRIFYHISE